MKLYLCGSACARSVVKETETTSRLFSLTKLRHHGDLSTTEEYHRTKQLNEIPLAYTYLQSNESLRTYKAGLVYPFTLTLYIQQQINYRHLLTLAEMC